MASTTSALDRRQFLAATAASAGVLCLPDLRWPLARKTPLFDISLAEWSLHQALQKKAMENLDFPKQARSFGIGAVEYVNSFWKDKARDEKYVAELKRRCEGEGVKSLLIMCDGEGALGDPKDAARKKAVENHWQWIEAAQALGCHSIRVNAQSSGSYEEQQKLAADGLHALCEYGDKFGIDVIVENHGGLSSNGKWLAETIKKADHKRAGTLPDFGNFRVSDKEEYDRYQGIDELMPFARGVSAKSHDFDAAGNETRTDYRKMMEIVVKKHGWRAFVGIEYEGNKLSEDDGIKATKKLLEVVREELATKVGGAKAGEAKGDKAGK